MTLSEEDKDSLKWMVEIKEQAKARNLAVKLDACGVLILALPRWASDEQLLMLPIKETKAANAEVSDGGPLTHKSPAAQSRRSLH